MRHLITTLLIASYGFCLAQRPSATTREAFGLQLLVSDSNFYETNISAGPYFVKEGVLQIYPGEKLYVEAKLKDGALHDMRVVADPKDTTKVIHIELRQSADGRRHEHMMLYVWNPFDGELQYNAMVFYMEHAQWAKTTILPVGPRIGGYEMWPEVIVTMTLSDWKVTSRN